MDGKNGGKGGEKASKVHAAGLLLSGVKYVWARDSTFQSLTNKHNSGGLTILNATEVLLSNSTFRGNVATQELDLSLNAGSAFSVHGSRRSQATKRLRIDSCVVQECKSTTAVVTVGLVLDVEIYNTTFADNVVDTYPGGGLYCVEG